MKKITKKEFIDTLCAYESAMCVRLNRDLTDSDLALMRGVTWDNMANDGMTKPVIRRVAKRQTNSVMFDNQSWLYFDQEGDKSYWRIGDTIMQRTKYDFSGREAVSILGYLINFNS